MHIEESNLVDLPEVEEPAELMPLTKELSRKASTSELANLDLLRAVAVGLVFLDHLFETMRIRGLGALGHLGVLFFFVHTSLVLMMSMERLGLRGLRLFGSFMTRRVFRIYPLSIAAVLFVVAFQVPATSWLGGYTWRGWPVFFSNILLVQNITKTSSVNSVLWSLPFEVQMYMVLPFLFLLLRRFSSIRAAWIAWLAGVMLAIGEYLIRASSTDIGFLLTRYVPCFLAGVLAWRFLTHSERRLSGIGWIVVLVLLIVGYRVTDAIRVYGPGVISAMHGSLRNDHLVAWPASMDLVNDWVFCCLAGLAIPLFADVKLQWLNATSKAIAKYSYGIYVCHVPILWLVFVKLHVHSSALRVLLALVMTGLVSVILFRFLEDPAIRLGKRLSLRVASAHAAA